MDGYDNVVRGTTDMAVGVAAMTVPWWIDWIQSGSAIIVALGGVVLMIMRLIVVVKEWQNAKKREKQLNAILP